MPASKNKYVGMAMYREPKQTGDGHNWLEDYLTANPQLLAQPTDTDRPSTHNTMAFAIRIGDVCDYVDMFEQEVSNVNQPVYIGQRYFLFKKIVLLISGNFTDDQLAQWEHTKGMSALDIAAILKYKIENASTPHRNSKTHNTSMSRSPSSRRYKP